MKMRLAKFGGLIEDKLPKGFVRLRRSVVLGQGEDSFQKASEAIHSFKPFEFLDWVDIASLRSGDLNAGDNLCTVSRIYNSSFWSLNPCRVVSAIRKGYYEALFLDPKRKSVNEGMWGVKVGGCFSEVVFATLRGHLLEGEESLRVYTLPSFLNGRNETNSIRSIEDLCLRSTIQSIEVQSDENISELSKVLSTTATNDIVVFEVLSYSQGSGLLGKLFMPFIRPLQYKFQRDICDVMHKLINQ